MSPKQRSIFIKGIGGASLVGLILFLSSYAPQPFPVQETLWGGFEDLEDFYSTRERLRRFLVSLGPYSSPAFIVLQALQVLVSPIPGELTGVVGGYLYGKSLGFLLSTLGLTLGSWLAFELSRAFGRPFVERFVSKRALDKFNFITTRTGATLCFLLFLLPGFPKDYLCYVVGLSRMKVGMFLIVSTIGRMPGTYLLTIQGASLRNQAYMSTAIFTAIFAGTLFLAYLYRRQLLLWVKSVR